jgi:uncharacterized protein YfaT (DUF1175 family)
MTATPFVVIAHRMARFGASTGPVQSDGRVVIFESREAAQIQADAWNSLNEREAAFNTPDLRIVPSSERRHRKWAGVMGSIHILAALH